VPPFDLERWNASGRKPNLSVQGLEDSFKGWLVEMNEMWLKAFAILRDWPSKRPSLVHAKRGELSRGKSGRLRIAARCGAARCGVPIWGREGAIPLESVRDYSRVRLVLGEHLSKEVANICRLPFRCELDFVLLKFCSEFEIEMYFTLSRRRSYAPYVFPAI